MFIALLLIGCAESRGPVFAPTRSSLVWPKSPAKARIAWVGQLSTSDDIKASQGIFGSVIEAAFGPANATGIVTPFAICTDGTDRLFITDTGAQCVHVFDLPNRKYAQWKPSGKTQFTQPVGIATDSAGQVFVSDSVSACIFVFDRTGKMVREFGEGVLKRPAGIAIDPTNGHIVVTDVGVQQVLVFAEDGDLLLRLGKHGTATGEFNFPTNVVVDREGYLFVSDSLNFRIQTFDPQYRFVRALGEPGDLPGYFGQPKGIAIDRDDHLYVVDARQEMIQIFDAGGKLLMTLGKEGSNPGEFSLPAGIHIDAHNRIWVADTYNRRVCVFDYLPEKQP